jgi:hypothetical protein
MFVSHSRASTFRGAATVNLTTPEWNFVSAPETASRTNSRRPCRIFRSASGTDAEAPRWTCEFLCTGRRDWWWCVFADDDEGCSPFAGSSDCASFAVSDLPPLAIGSVWNDTAVRTPDSEPVRPVFAVVSSVSPPARTKPRGVASRLAGTDTVGSRVPPALPPTVPSTPLPASNARRSRRRDARVPLSAVPPVEGVAVATIDVVRASPTRSTLRAPRRDEAFRIGRDEADADADALRIVVVDAVDVDATQARAGAAAQNATMQLVATN